MSRKLRIGLIVTVGFLFTVGFTFVSAWRQVPLEVRYFCSQLLRPGMKISERWLEPDCIGHPVACFSGEVALNTLLYSGLLGLFLWLLRPMLNRHKSPS